MSPVMLSWATDVSWAGRRRRRMFAYVWGNTRAEFA
jgi:hypothetical protein